MWSRRRAAAIALIMLAAGVVLLVRPAPHSGLGPRRAPQRSRPGAAIPDRRPHEPRPSACPRHKLVVGRSVQGRPIRVTVLGDRRAARPLLVVGAIHGDESAGLRVVRALIDARPSGQTAIWILQDLNPDGVAAGTRQNARGVDLNRNFPLGWRPLGHRGDQQYSGARALSEPESRAAQRLMLRIRPRIAIWFHQPLGVVDDSGGAPAVERRFARLAGLPLRRLTRYPGSATGWENSRIRGSSAFVVELRAGRLSASGAARLADGVLRLADSRVRTPVPRRLNPRC